jgi:phosphoenolpyruvate-protein phosphotransferase (PTS system enzyme I)
MVRKGKRRVLQAVGAAPGQAIGPAHRLIAREIRVPRLEIPASGAGAEIRRFRGALRSSRAELQQLRAHLGRGSLDPGGQILDSHLMILQDRELMREIIEAIKAERLTAAYVAHRAFLAKAHYLESLSSEVFRARAADIRDLCNRVLGHLLGEGGAAGPPVPDGAVIIAAEIAPSRIAALDPARIAALITQHGTLVSHVTIMARSRGVPAVIGVGEAIEEIADGDTVLVDGARGIVIVTPNREDLACYEQWRDGEARLARLLAGSRKRPAETLDGKRIPVLANIDRPEDAAGALEAGADGIGLFRTEFFFMDAATFPDEATQVAAYRSVVRALGGRPVTIRTLDVGGDKQAALMGIQPEANPYLGLRGVRFCLANRDIFATQLRALARAAAEGPLRVLVPMVGSLEQWRATRALLAEAAGALGGEAGRAAPAIALGPMIELPAAMLMADRLARESDFFSIGSNDLIQYTLAVDRGNNRIAHLYDALDPSVLRAIDLIVRQARPAGIPVGSCGEMSGELPDLLLLVGLGVDELSVAGSLVPRVKAILSGVAAADLARMARRCLEAASTAEVRQLVTEELRSYPQFKLEAVEGGRLRCRWEPETE